MLFPIVSTAQLHAILQTLQLAVRLKFELRHSYLSNGRQESVAEHTWRMALMAMLLGTYLSQRPDMEKLLKMIIIHDLIEAEASDMSVLDVLRNPALRTEKVAREQQAIENLRRVLGAPVGEEVYRLWYEFEYKHTYEAKVANAIDKLEVQLQHNHADFGTWEEIEYDMSYTMDPHVGFDPVMQQLKDLIEQQAEAKMQAAGVDVATVRVRARVRE